MGLLALRVMGIDWVLRSLEREDRPLCISGINEESNATGAEHVVRRNGRSIRLVKVPLDSASLQYGHRKFCLRDGEEAADLDGLVRVHGVESLTDDVTGNRGKSVLPNVAVTLPTFRQHQFRIDGS